MGMGDMGGMGGSSRDSLAPMQLDPSLSLQRMRDQNIGDSGDIDLMQMHLDKMGDSFSGMDYY
jgi:hypothetical protein